MACGTSPSLAPLQRRAALPVLAPGWCRSTCQWTKCFRHVPGRLHGPLVKQLQEQPHSVQCSRSAQHDELRSCCPLQQCSVASHLRRSVMSCCSARRCCSLSTHTSCRLKLWPIGGSPPDIWGECEASAAAAAAWMVPALLPPLPLPKDRRTVLPAALPTLLALGLTVPRHPAAPAAALPVLLPVAAPLIALALDALWQRCNTSGMAVQHEWHGDPKCCVTLAVIKHIVDEPVCCKVCCYLLGVAEACSGWGGMLLARRCGAGGGIAAAAGPRCEADSGRGGCCCVSGDASAQLPWLRPRGHVDILQRGAAAAGLGQRRGVGAARRPGRARGAAACRRSSQEPRRSGLSGGWPAGGAAAGWGLPSRKPCGTLLGRSSSMSPGCRNMGDPPSAMSDMPTGSVASGDCGWLSCRPHMLSGQVCGGRQRPEALLHGGACWCGEGQRGACAPKWQRRRQRQADRTAAGCFQGAITHLRCSCSLHKQEARQRLRSCMPWRSEGGTMNSPPRAAYFLVQSHRIQLADLAPC